MLCLVFAVVILAVMWLPSPPPGSRDKPPPPDAVPIVFGALSALGALGATIAWLGERRADRAAPRGFMPWERRRRRSPDGRTTLYRVGTQKRQGRTCVMLARWHYRRRRWRRDDVLAHVWVAPSAAAGVRRRMEITARRLQAADPDDYVEPDRKALRRSIRAWQHHEGAAFQAEIEALQAELDATEGLVEDLAGDPR